MTTEVKFRRITANAVPPERATSGAAAHDLFSNDPGITIMPGDAVRINTGIAVELPPGHALFVFARSGLAIKHGVRLSNGVGVIDEDYRGEIVVGLHNDGPEPVRIERGHRVAQAIVMPMLAVAFHEVRMLSHTERGAGGLGSTGR